MKIVHVVYSLEMGGAEVLVAQLCRIQRANGHDVSLCAYSKLGPIGETLLAEGFSIYVPGEAHPSLTIFRYLRHFLRLRPDVVHCHNHAPTLQAALPGRLSGAKCVLSTRHSLVEPPYDYTYELMFSIISRFCNYVVGICDITCENLRRIPWAAKKKVVRVYNGTNPIHSVNSSPLETDSAEQPLESNFTLLYVGRLATVKSLDILIRAVAIAAEKLPGLRLWIVGDGVTRASLEALAAELGVTNHIRFWGLRLDTAVFFSAADALAMSSISEGLPMSLLQAMSIGLPAITTDVGGMAEVLCLSHSGLLVPYGNPAAFAEAILRLAADPALCADLSTRGIDIYKKHFTLEQMDAAYMRLYLREPPTL